MKRGKSAGILVIIMMLILAACSPNQTDVPATSPVASAATEMEAESSMADSSTAGQSHSTEEMVPDAPNMQETADESHESDNVMAADESMGATSDKASSMDAAAGMEVQDVDTSMRPAWQSLELVNATTGETFTLGGFEGKTVFVEPMATWCTNCRQQLNNVAKARAQLGDDVVFVGLSLETTLDPADLAAYQSANGFDWTFAVMSDEMLQGLADQFGRSLTSAPSTPHFVIRPDGSFTELSTGVEQPDELVALLQAAQS